MSRMDGTDADGEWSDEEVLQSGSQTGLSETEQEDGPRDPTVQILRPTTPFRGNFANVHWAKSSPIVTTIRTSDPVSVMMEKIDAEIHAIEKEESKTTWPPKFNDRSRNNESSQEHSRARQTDTTLGNPESSRSLKEPGKSENILSRKSLNSILLQDKKDTYTASHESDVPSDLDPITAREIDARFKEIMSKKKGITQTDQKKEPVLESPRRSGRHNQSAITPSRLVTIRESPVISNDLGQGRQLDFLLSRLRVKNACRPSAVMLSAGGYATDNESVKTEDFESKFLSLMVNPPEADRQHQTTAKRLDTDDVARRPASDANLQPSVKMQLSRPRSCSPVRMGLQRYRTTDNSRGFWDSKLSSNKKGSQVFSWDDEFWKQSSRRGPQSVASSFEEVESLCLSKSSSDSMGSTQRHWDRLGHPGGAGQDPGAWGSKRRFMSRQSSTTSTSTSRSSGLVGDQVSAEANAEPALQNASIKDTLLESMELLGAHGNLDLTEKIYLEKIFHRVLDWNNGIPVSSSSSSKAMDKHFWGPMQQSQVSTKVREQQKDTNSPQLHATLRERLEKINQREQPRSKVVLQLPSPAEKKRRRDLIVPDDEESVSSSFKQHKLSAMPDSVSTTSSSKDTSRSSKANSVGDTSSRYSYISSMSSVSIDNGSVRGSPQGSTAPPAAQSPSLASFLPPTFRLSGSFESTASPPDTYMFNQPYTPSHAERVLMGLGFGATEGFLPERFLRDWYSKIAKAQMEAQIAAHAEVKTPDISENSPTFPMTTPVTPDIEVKTKERRDSHVSIASSMLDEASNLFPSNMSQDSKTQRLKEYIAAYSNNSNSPTEAREFTLRHFAPTRQKSLPLFLETLSEEEEGRSRISGVDPFDKEARLRMFISDAMSSSGKSTGSNSENSYISSNQSESDSVSSSSEKISSQHRKNQHIKAYNKHLAEERKMENERKENEASGQTKKDGNSGQASDDKRHKPRPKGSPVRQSTVKRNENFEKATSQKNSSSNTLNQQSLSQVEAVDLSTASEDRSSPNKGATSEKQNSIHSKDSIEVEEIILYKSIPNKSLRLNDDNTGETKKIGAVEPAMVSIVLEDVDRDAGCSDSLLPVSYLGLPASRCSSSSLSPIPQSPVTVIEVGLDNQQDSLDTEGTGSSRETDDDTFPQQTSSSEDAGGRHLTRPRSRCSKSYQTSALGKTPRRRNSSASPLPLSKSGLSPSQEFDQQKPRRRLSLEVPVTPEVRYMLERQRAYNTGQFSDDTQLSRVREAESRPNSETDEKVQLHISEENSTRTQEQRPSSPRTRPDSREYAFRGNCEVILDTKVDSQKEGIKRMSTMSVPCQCYIKSRAYQPLKETSMNENSISKSTESSPGSGRSAFRIATKSKRESSIAIENSGLEARGSNNSDGLPSNSNSVFRPHVIGSMHPSEVDYVSSFSGEIRNSDGSSPPLHFSDTRPMIKDLRTFSGSRNMVHSISRAVQVNESLLFSRPSSQYHHLPLDCDYFYACDRSTQCSIFDDAARDQWSCRLGVSIFNKCTQTGVPTFEISCQTHDTPSHLTSETGQNSHFPSHWGTHFQSKAVNTVMSLIGREHESDLQCGSLRTNLLTTRHETVADFRFVDETLEQIEKELNFINKKEYVNYLNFIAKADQLNSNEKAGLMREPGVSFQALSNIKRWDKMCERSKSLASDESVSSRIAPSSWCDATNIGADCDKTSPVGFNDVENMQRIDGFEQTTDTMFTKDKLTKNYTINEKCASYEDSEMKLSNVTESLVTSGASLCYTYRDFMHDTPETDRETNTHCTHLSKAFSTSECKNITKDTGSKEDGNVPFPSDIIKDILHSNNEEIPDKEKEPGLVNCSTESKLNTSANECQEKVTQWRRFSLPTIGYQKTGIRSHSKLSRLKYQTNSQNSYNSLDLELDFMNASDPISKFSHENPKKFQRQKQNKPFSSCNANSMGRHVKLDYVRNLPPEEDFEDAHSFLYTKDSPKFNELTSHGPIIKKPTSPKIIALRGDTSPGQSPDVDSGTSTPEIFISPLKTFQMDFLRIPGSPKDYVTKAVYPSSSSSGSTSPFKESGLTAKAINSEKVDNVSVKCEEEEAAKLDLTPALDVHRGISSLSSMSSLEYFQNVEHMKNSMSDSDLPASTVDSTVDVSLKSSIEQSADEFSDASMLPRLSVDSAMEELKQEKHETELSIVKRNFSETTKALEGVDASSLHFYTTSSLKLQGDRYDSVQNKPNESGSPESFDVDEVSNRSFAGSDVAIHDLDLDLEERFITRSSSTSSYSEPMLDNIGSLSQDSLSCEDAQLLMNYLRIGEHMDDLLQVSDYGGASPSPTKMRSSMEDSSSILDVVFPDSPRKLKVTKNKMITTSGKSLGESYISKDNLEYENEFLQQNDSNGVQVETGTKQSFKEQIQNLNCCETVLKKSLNVENFKTKNPELLVDESSGDECDKEIFRINLNRPMRKRLIRMSSDPVDKEIFCRSKQLQKQTSAPKASLKKDEQNSNEKIEDCVKLVESKLTLDRPSSSDMMAVFQSADLSYLQNCLDYPLSQRLMQKIEPVEDLNETLNQVKKPDICPTACVLSVEFTVEDLEDVPDINEEGGENLGVMMSLFDTIDDYGHHKSFLDDELILSPARHFPLPQISEEGTVSEDTSDGGGLSHKKTWFSKKCSEDSDCVEAANVKAKDAEQHNKDGEFLQDYYLFSYQERENLESTANINISVSGATAPHFEVCDNDDVFKDGPQIINSIYSRQLNNQDVPGVNIRAVSPSSKVFDFAQSLVDNTILWASPAHALEQCQDSIDWTSSDHYNGDDETADSSNFSLDSIGNSGLSQELTSETHTVEKKIDLLGTVVTKFASTHTVKFNHMNALPTESNVGHKKHISTASVMIGDYRNSRVNTKVQPKLLDCSERFNESYLEPDSIERSYNGESFNSNSSNGTNSNAKFEFETFGASKKKQLQNKLRAFLLSNEPQKPDSKLDIRASLIDEDPSNSGGETLLTAGMVRKDVCSDNDPSTRCPDEEIDMRSRVKALFLIDDRKVSENAAPESRHVKVTTMFSRNSKEARSSFSSTSISDLDESGAGAESEPVKLSSVNVVRTLNTSDAPSSAEAKKNPRKLRTRDSLLKLHEQANVSSSIGSDTDSELIAALRNQGDYDVRERDLALGLLTGDAIDEDDHPARFSDAPSCEPDRGNNKYMTIIEAGQFVDKSLQSSVCSAVLQFNEALSPDSVAREFSPPKVVIQQPSEDNSQENLRRLNLPLLSFSSITIAEQGNVSPPLDNADSKHTSLTKHGSTSNWLRRSPRMHLLSPSAALTKKKSYDELQPKDYSTRVTDESHPELDYLDILPKLSQHETDEFRASRPNQLQSRVHSVRHNLPRLLLHEPDDEFKVQYETGAPRISMRSPEPRPLIDFGEDGHYTAILTHDSVYTPSADSLENMGLGPNIKIGLPLEISEREEYDYKCHRWSENADDSEVTDTDQFYKADNNELIQATSDMEDFFLGRKAPNNNDTGVSQLSSGIFFVNDSIDALSCNANEGFKYLYDDSTFNTFMDQAQSQRRSHDGYMSPLHMEIAAADEANVRNLTGHEGFDSAADFDAYITASSIDAQQNYPPSPRLSAGSEPVVESRKSESECYIESLTPWSNVIDNVAAPGDVLDPQTQYKKLLSVTSHDSGFDSQGSPIELSTLKTADWASTHNDEADTF